MARDGLSRSEPTLRYDLSEVRVNNLLLSFELGSLRHIAAIPSLAARRKSCLVAQIAKQEEVMRRSVR